MRENSIYDIYINEIHISNNNSRVRNIIRAEKPSIDLENLFKILLDFIRKKYVPVE